MAAWTEANVDARKLLHHLFNRSEVLLRRIGDSHQLADGGQVFRPVSVG